ncbi:zeta toxin family protein, partial [Streptomyces niveus]|uniref:zeta toxin family protein n=1 Tax=Streptomyces niveus TaxID=193462 RepID=UPI0035E0333A
MRQDQPVTVIVGGQPGAGKTAVADLVQAALDRRGGAVRVCSDRYKAAHREYGKLLAVDVRTAGGGGGGGPPPPPPPPAPPAPRTPPAARAGGA